MNVPFYKHNLEKEDIDELVDTLSGVFLTTGPKTKEFEAQFAKYFGMNSALGFTSWTNAAFLVLKAWGVGPGDEVIVPAMTFIASSNIVIHCGAKPVFVDVEPETGNMDISCVEKAITANTKAVMPVHLYGQMVDMKALSALCKPKGIKILEDCAHCIEGARDGYQPGHHSDAAAFSFYATKNLTCGEGGAVITNDEELVESLRLLRLHGMSKSAAERYTKSYQHWDMEVLGFKANMSDIQASLLLKQFARLDQAWQRKQEISEKYEAHFKEHGIEFPKVLSDSKSARHLFTILAPAEKRDSLLDKLQEAGVGVAVNFRAVHLLKYYRETFGYERGAYPVAESWGDRTITLPLYPKLSDTEVQYVCDSVVKAYS